MSGPRYVNNNETVPLNLSRSSEMGKSILLFSKDNGRAWAWEPVIVKQAKNEDALNREIEVLKILQQADAPHVIKFYGKFLDEKSALGLYKGIALEYAELGSLAQCYKINEEEISHEMRASMLLNIACGLKILHELNIHHRDIKSANILLDRYYSAKIADFDMSGFNETRLIPMVGTWPYMAPELFNYKILPIAKKYIDAVDVYAFAIVMLEITNWASIYDLLKPTLEDLNKFNLKVRENSKFAKNFERAKAHALSGFTPNVPRDEWPVRLSKLVKLASHKDPEQRPTMEKIYSELNDVLGFVPCHEELKPVNTSSPWCQFFAAAGVATAAVGAGILYTQFSNKS